MKIRRALGIAGAGAGIAGMLMAGWSLWGLAAQSDRSEHETPIAAQRSGSPNKTGIASTPSAGVGDESEFVDPERVARHFASELANLLKKGKAPTPGELFRQAESATNCDVLPLADAGRKLSAEAIYARARPSVVVVGALMPSGGHRHKRAALATGFVIRKDGVIVTNYHVLDAFQYSRAIGVMTHDGRLLPVRAVLAADSHNDLAVIKADADNLVPLPIAAAVPVGATVYSLSHPALDTDDAESGFFTFTQGMVCGKFRLRFDGPVPVDILAITAEYAKGSSGGPVLNENGAVVGVICQTRALFYDQEESEPQLTWKFSRPSKSLLAMLKTPGNLVSPRPQ